MLPGVVMVGRRAVGLVALAGGVFAAGAAGQDAVTYKKFAEKAGDRIRVTKTEAAATDTAVTVMGRNQKKSEKKVKTVVYVDEVVTPGPAGGKTVKRKRAYETATEAKDGGPAAKLPLAGRTVVIEKVGDKFTFTPVGGGALPKAAADELDNEFNKRDDSFGPDELFPADKPVKVGDAWDVTDKLVRSLTGSDSPFVPAEGKAKATAKLVRLAQEGGRTVGELKVTADVPVAELRAGKGPVLKLTGDSSLKLDLTGRAVMDGSAPGGAAAGKMTITIDGEVQGVAVKVTAVVDTTSKAELVKE